MIRILKVTFALSIFSWLSIALTISAQEPVQDRFKEWEQEKYQIALPKTNISFLNPKEKELVRYINLMRLNPELFANTYLEHYGKAIDSNRYYIAYHKLINAKPLPPLDVKYQLWQSARAQAKNLVENNSSSSTHFGDRIHQFLPGITVAGTAYQYGESEPIVILCKLLIKEEGAFEHTLMANNLNLIGLTVQPHPNECFHTVIDLAKGEVNKVKLNNFENQTKNGPYIGQNECPPGSKVKVRRRLRL